MLWFVNTAGNRGSWLASANAMNNPKATILAGGITETRTEEAPKTAKETKVGLEAKSFDNQTKRATTETPILSEMLAQVEGVARWGLNE